MSWTKRPGIAPVGPGAGGRHSGRGRLLRLLALAAASLAATAPARAENPMPLVRADDWGGAAAAAANAADPVARKLVLFYRLLDPGAARPDEISAFLADNPRWPDRAVLALRRQQAIAADADPADAAAQCAEPPITLPDTLAHCAEAFAATGQQVAATSAAQRAWAAGLRDPALVPAFLHRWSGVLTAADEWARFRRLLHADPTAAAAQIRRLPPARQPTARAWLALQRDAPNAFALAQALPPAARSTPGLVLAEATWLRRAKRDSEALAYWRLNGFAAEAAAPAEDRADFWNQREILARDLLRQGDAAAAFVAADDTLQTEPAAVASTGFLAGFIALTRLHDPALAARCFHRMLGVSHAVITDARAHYWLGRAAAAAGADPGGEYRAAAAFPTTFYGQAAARALGEHPAALLATVRDPGFTRAETLAFTGHELVRAALLLAAWSEPGRARAFLLKEAELNPDPATQTLCARLGLALGVPDVAVFIARRMGLQGRMLPRAGWPMPVQPPAADGIDPAVVLALIRQESSFDRGAVSPSGARGLMQLLPSTAMQEATTLGATVTPVALTTDATRNMQLGTAYLRQLLARFDGSLPLALAAYNAGPHKVDQWIAQNGAPAPGAAGMLDWIELIPYGETRNYVQRVLENVVVYQARRDAHDPALIAQWLPGPAASAPGAAAAK
jgi:peptidoglycan lytic transglycosylase